MLDRWQRSMTLGIHYIVPCLRGECPSNSDSHRLLWFQSFYEISRWIWKDLNILKVQNTYSRYTVQNGTEWDRIRRIGKSQWFSSKFDAKNGYKIIIQILPITYRQHHSVYSSLGERQCRRAQILWWDQMCGRIEGKWSSSLHCCSCAPGF